MSMKRDASDGVDWGSKPYNRTDKLKAKASDAIEEQTDTGASRLYEELTASRNGELEEVRTGWFEPINGLGYDPESLYFFSIGPTVATAPGVTWEQAFTMDLDTAPAFNTDAWKDMASEFQLSDRDEREGVISKVRCMYSTIEEGTRRTDAPRAFHPRELRNSGPYVHDAAFEFALDCLGDFAGVAPPVEDGPIWSYTPTAEAGGDD